MLKKKLWTIALTISMLCQLTGCAGEKQEDANSVPTVTVAPTAAPTEEPVATATEVPTAAPTEEPVATATEVPTAAPTEEPVATATEVPTAAPTEEPVATATEVPTAAPTEEPVATATEAPTPTPTVVPTATPEPTVTPTPAPTESATVSGAMRDITTMKLVRDMGIGINLGNTFESCGDWINNSQVKNYETGWGSPVVTEAMIAGYKEAGFGVLRIPVAWSNMMQEDYTIHPDYLARVKEVVTWAIEHELYVILNIHWDGGWWTEFPTEKEECMYKYVRIWTQLSEEFRDFGDYLMFESLNEEGCWDSVWNRWGGTNGKEEAYGLLNEINQTFVDTVRASGGNNAARHLLIAGYATDIDLTCDALYKMPEDPSGRMAVSVHYYTPSTFCILEADADWGKAKTDWGSAADVQELERNMDKLKATFIDNGIPVIIGEYGVSRGNKTDEVVRLFLSSVCEEAYSREICPVLWDVTKNFYDRYQYEMYDKTLQNELLSVLEP